MLPSSRVAYKFRYILGELITVEYTILSVEN